MTKDNNNIIMLTLTNGMEVITQVVDVDNTEWYTIQNPVAIIRDEEDGDRINMRPLFQYGRRDADIKIHTRKVDVLYTPTSGLIGEYLTVFINATNIDEKAEHIHEEAVEEEVAVAVEEEVKTKSKAKETVKA